METINTYSNQKFIIGDNFLEDFREIFRQPLANKKILLIIGKESFQRSPYAAHFENELANFNSGIVYTMFSTANPKDIAIKNELDLIPTFDCILAIGGGSVIDTAKKIKIDLNAEVNFYCIYTRYGSGSVVTPFYVFDNDEFKIGEHDDRSIPSIIYASTELMDQLSEKQRLIGICDIFAHAVESFFSTAGSDAQKIEARAIIMTIDQETIKCAAQDIIKLDVRAGLVESDCFVLSPHSLGHYLTYKTGLEHGIASIITLPGYVQFLNDHIKIDQKLYMHIQTVAKSFLQTTQTPFQIDGITILINELDTAWDLITKYMDFTINLSPYPITKKDVANMLLTL